MENENNKNGKYTGYFSKRLKAGKRRTYFFDVRSTKQGDYFLTITESKKKFDDSFESHKIFLYKEDFKKFLETLNETVDYVKTELMPDYDYDSERPAKSGHEEQENHREEREREPQREKQREPQREKPAYKANNAPPAETTTPINTTPPPIGDDEEVDWN